MHNIYLISNVFKETSVTQTIHVNL